MCRYQLGTPLVFCVSSPFRAIFVGTLRDSASAPLQKDRAGPREREREEREERREKRERKEGKREQGKEGKRERGDGGKNHMSANVAEGIGRITWKTGVYLYKTSKVIGEFRAVGREGSQGVVRAASSGREGKAGGKIWQEKMRIRASSKKYAFGQKRSHGARSEKHLCDIRIVSYNVLSSSLAPPSQFPKCAETDLDANVRLARLKHKLLEECKPSDKNGNRGSIFCLQEVSREWSGELHTFFAGIGYHLVTASYGSFNL